MSRKATDIRKGNVLILEGVLWQVIEREHIAPGNWRAINHFKLKNLATGQSKQLRAGSGENFEVAFLEKRDCQYLYKDAGTGSFVFMDQGDFEQYELSEDVLGNSMSFVKEEQVVQLTFHDGTPVDVELPASVTLKVIESDPAVKGNTVSNVFKRAVVETGLEVKVPMHISVDELVKISTETGEFQGRSKD